LEIPKIINPNIINHFKKDQSEDNKQNHTWSTSNLDIPKT
jgi:hypothetical protein